MTDTAESWRLQAAALRAEQRMSEAETAIARARSLAPTDPLIAFLHAQSRYELGYPASALFTAVVQMWPANLDALRNQALAAASEGDNAAAEALLVQALRARPDWLDGQRVLAALRWTSGQAQTFDAGYVEATQALPNHQGLWLAWFSALAQHRDWARSQTVLGSATLRLGNTRQLQIAKAFLACESGDTCAGRAALNALHDVRDDFLEICRLRFALRSGDPQAALAIALPLTATPLARQAWPYIGTAWRLLGDAHAEWLDGDPRLVGIVDGVLDAGELRELAETLRGLHTARAAYADQSVRGGTQTDRSVLLRHEPILNLARCRLMAAMAEFAVRLPSSDLRHPILGRARSNLRISGSWSVRLTDGGFNVSHTHPAGWFSSAFYVALPEPDAMGAVPSGFLQLGAPPAELEIDLQPCRQIEPIAGRLVIFPSIMWHGTVPFGAGERLNIAFDVVPCAV